MRFTIVPWFVCPPRIRWDRSARTKLPERESWLIFVRYLGKRTVFVSNTVYLPNKNPEPNRRTIKVLTLVPPHEALHKWSPMSQGLSLCNFEIPDPLNRPTDLHESRRESRLCLCPRIHTTTADTVFPDSWPFLIPGRLNKSCIFRAPRTSF